jgi:putative tricarboxylic transport membrane protein
MKSTFTVATLTTCAALLLGGCSGGEGNTTASGGHTARGTIKIVVAMAAGGGSDRAGRIVSQAVNETASGFSTVVENREGGGGAVGWTYFAGLRGRPDNLLVAETALHTLPRQDGVDVPFTYQDFTPLALFAEDSPKELPIVVAGARNAGIFRRSKSTAVQFQ